MVKSKKLPLFSILLPTYNRADVIIYSIESVLSQTYRNFELLIVNDGCTDKTEQIVRGYMKRDRRIHLYSFSKGKGFGYEHRNMVLKKAKGKYIAFAAHDDLWLPDHLRIFHEYFKDNPEVELAYSRPLWIDPDGIILPSCLNTNSLKMKQLFLYVRNELPAISVVHTKKSAQEVQFINLEMKEGGDWDLWKKIINSKVRHPIGFIPTPTTIHFRANWRTKRFYRDAYLDRFHELISTNAYLKKKLKINLKRREALQKTVWHNVCKKSWINTLRNTVICVIDEQSRIGLAMSASKKAQPIYIQKLEADLSKVMSTKSYQLFNTLRRLFRFNS